MQRMAWAAVMAPLSLLGAESTQFAGVLPCADCPALFIELTLSKDARGAPSTYRQRSTYVDRRGKDLPFTSGGRWSIVPGAPADSQATFYRLVDPKTGERQLLKVVGEHSLRFVDNEGRDIDSPIPQVLWRRSADAKPVTIGRSDAGRTLRVNAGEEVVVTLPSNRSTGFRWWMAPEATEPLVALSATPAYKRDTAGDRVGAQGEETWRLFAFRPGTQQVLFEYRRSWERDVPPAETFSFMLEVH